jgi:hypothetical protein
MHGRHPESAVYWLMGLLVAYVLSTGPMAVLIHKGALSRDAFGVIYYPLKLAANVPGAGPALEGYVRLWAGPP